jgi:hypothetical protein
VVRAFAGSTSPNYIQADWYSGLSLEGMTAEVKSTVTVPGDPIAGKLPRNWINAMIMATTDEEMRALHEEAKARRQQEAVAYIAEGVVRVGVDPNRASLPLFGRLSRMGEDNERAIAMRLGGAPLEATMGLWLPSERAFVGVETLCLVNEGVHVNQFAPLSQLLSEVPVL